MVEPLNELVTRAPHPRLRPFVESYSGYRVLGFEPGTHAGLPSGALTFIVSFDRKLDVSTTSGGRDTYWAMLAGLHATPATIHHTGNQYGIQLSITPRGALALFGLPAGAVAEQTAQLDDILGPAASELVDRLSAATHWRTRWAILDQVFLHRLDIDQAISPELERAWALLRSSHGGLGVEALAAEAGWSRRHFTKKFRSTYGLTPKVMARILRFERAQQMVRLPTRPSLASVAAAAGYADQAHMTREWVEFAGASPTVWMADESIPIVQDEQHRSDDA